MVISTAMLNHQRVPSFTRLDDGVRTECWDSSSSTMAGVAHFKTSADSSVKGQTAIDQFEPKYTMHDYNPKKALGIIESMGSP